LFDLVKDETINFFKHYSWEILKKHLKRMYSYELPTSCLTPNIQISTGGVDPE
jgi:hypothetical protein